MMKTYRYEASQALFRRAAKIIPNGIYGHLSPAPLVPPTDYPLFASRAKGARFWDVDGNEFIDYMCGYGPMVLGYCDEGVDRACLEQLRKGDTMTAPGPVMVELAELLVDLIAGAGWAFFAKNGGDATGYAVMIARAATGRPKVVAIQGGYHGVAAWMQGAGYPGVIDDDARNVLRIRWNDLAELERVIDENRGQVACFIASPYHHPAFADSEMPAEGYWSGVEALCRKSGIALIVDDVRCGFRLDLRGSHAYFGFQPDLVCFGKAIANGHALSAVVGTAALKSAAAKVFHTGSFWFQAAPMAAAIATLQELKRLDAPKVMLETGRRLLQGMEQVARSHGYQLKTSGAPSMPTLRLADDESLMLHQRWCGECTRRGAFFSSHHNWFLSIAHTDDDIERTLEICDDAFKALKAGGR